MNRTSKLQTEPLFFAPRWISEYLVKSIQKCGDISLAYDLMLQEYADDHYARDIKPKKEKLQLP